MEEEMVTGMCLPYVPPSLRLPREGAIQSPLFHTPELRRAFYDALDWARLERIMTRAA